MLHLRHKTGHTAHTMGTDTSEYKKNKKKVFFFTCKKKSILRWQAYLKQLSANSKTRMC